MVLNKFGESDENSNPFMSQRVVKGDPGIGFKLTNDDNYDMKNKKLCNTQDPEEDKDVATKSYVLNINQQISNHIQDVDNKYSSETSKINALITTKSIENNERLKSFSDTTEKIINLKCDTINKKILQNKETFQALKRSTDANTHQILLYREVFKKIF